MDRLKNMTVYLQGTTTLSAQITDLKMAPADPILGTKIAFQKDSDPNKMNLGVGAYRDENGKPYVFKVVQKIEAAMHNKALNHVLMNPLRNIWTLKEILILSMEPGTSSSEQTAKPSKAKGLRAPSPSQELELSISVLSLSGNSCLERCMFQSQPGEITLELLRKWDFQSRNTPTMTPKPKVSISQAWFRV